MWMGIESLMAISNAGMDKDNFFDSKSGARPKLCVFVSYTSFVTRFLTRYSRQKSKMVIFIIKNYLFNTREQVTIYLTP